MGTACPAACCSPGGFCCGHRPPEQCCPDSWRTAHLCQVCCSTALSSATGTTIPCCLWSKPLIHLCPSTARQGPEGSDCSRKAQLTYQQDQKHWGASCTEESLVLWLFWWYSTKPRHQGSGGKGERKEKVLPFSSSLLLSYLELEAQLHTAGLSHTVQCPCWVKKGQQGWSCEGLLYKDICFLPEKYRNSVWLKRNP